VQQQLGLINEIMNVNSRMVLKSNHCYQKKWLMIGRLGVATEASLQSLQ